MKNFLFFFLFFILGCSNQLETNLNISNIMSFDEFEQKVIDYAQNNPYPNIDE